MPADRSREVHGRLEKTFQWTCFFGEAPFVEVEGVPVWLILIYKIYQEQSHVRLWLGA